MAYGRRRSTYRRKGRRGHRTLSTRNIFNNKSARAQARQISSLKRRINYVYRQCRPEVKLHEPLGPTVLTMQADLPSGYAFHRYLIEMPDIGPTDNDRIGNSCNVKDVKVYMNMRMGFAEDVAVQLNGTSQTVNTTIRVVAAMFRAGSDAQPQSNDVFSSLSTLTQNAPLYNLNPISPLAEGVSSRFKILCDKRYHLNFDDRNTLDTILKVKGSSIQKYIDTQYTTYGKAEIFLFITWNGLEPLVYQGTTLATPITTLTLNSKVAYTDP